jgi:hypothetical protein
MLEELEHVRQRPEEGSRRWFADDEFDLIVWYSHDGELIGFQLCYDKPGTERALTWRTDGSFMHHRVDTGDSVAGGMKKTAMLVEDGEADTTRIASEFREAAKGIDPDLADLVYAKVLGYPDT